MMEGGKVTFFRNSFYLDMRTDVEIDEAYSARACLTLEYFKVKINVP